MFTKSTIALAVILGITSGALAETKRQHSTTPALDAYNARAEAKRQHSPNPAWDVYDSRGVYVGSDPDPRIRAEMLRDSGTAE